MTKTVKDSVSDAQITLINAQNLYIVELEQKIKELSMLPLGDKLKFKVYYDQVREQFEDFKKNSG